MSAILPSHSYRRRFVFAGVALVVGLLSCVGGDSVGTGGAAALGIVPSFQIGPSDFDSAPIDQIRTNAYDGTSLESVGSTDDNVDPDAAEWSIAIGIDLGGESSREVLLDIELLSENVVQWSGRAGPIIAILGGVPDVLQVPVYRGPLDNLEVEDVTIVGAPTQLLAGASGTATATVQLPPGSSANPEVFWVSLDPTIATVVESGGVATITGVAAGTVTIGAAAGPAFDEVSVEVLPRVSVVDVAPDLTTTDVIDLDVQYTATVLDGFGDPAPGEPVTWSSTDPGVATVDQTGLATTVGFGTTEIQATAGGVTGSGTLTVNGPDLLIADLTVTPDGQGTIVDLAEVQFDADIENAGPSLAAASTLGIRVLDAATGQEAHPTLEYSIPPVNAGEFFSFSDFGGGQVQAGTLPTQLRFEFVADFLGAVAEQDESNNVQVSGDFDVGPTGPTTTTWTGAVDTDWATAGNWSGGQVPQAGEDVIIPLTGNQPVLNVTAVVGDLTIDPNAALTIADVVFLGVLGDISIGAGGALAAEIPGGSSVVQITGPSSINGLIEPSITMTGAVTLSAPVTTSGSVIVSGVGASLDLADQLLQVDGSFVTGDGGVLIMNGAQSATLNVANGIVFSGGSTEGLLTAGIIRANADFTVAGGSPTAFAPTGLHSVVFQGGATRSVSFDTPSPVGGRFNIVWFDVANTVQLDTDVIVTNEMQVFLGTVTSTGVLSIAGRLIDPTGGLSVTSLRFIGDVSAVPGTVPGPLFIDGGVTWPESATVAGDITIGGTLDVGDFGLTINGDIFVNGSLTVPALGTMSATGALELGAGSLLDVDGAITATDGCIDNGATISGTGSTPCGGPQLSVWVGGDAGGPTAWQNANNWSPVGVPGVTDDVSVPATANDPALVDDGVVGSIVVEPGATLDLGGFLLTVVGNVDAGQTIVNGVVNITGGGTVLQGTFDDLILDFDRTTSGDLTVVGNLTLVGGSLSVEDQTVSVGGDLGVVGSARLITLTGTSALIDVEGNALFDGGGAAGLMRRGVLRVAGDFTVTNATTAAFPPDLDHETILDGTTSQSVSFAFVGPSNQRFHNLSITNTAGVTFTTFAHVTGDMNLTGQWTVPVNTRTWIDGDLTLESGSVLNIEGEIVLSAGSSCIDNGATITGSGTHPCVPPLFSKIWVGGDAAGPTDTENPNNWSPVGVPVPTDDVLVPVTANDPVLTDLGVLASATVDPGATVDLNGFTLTVNGDLDAGGTIVNGLVVIGGGGSVLQGTVDDLEIRSNRVLSGDLVVAGDLTLNNADLNPGANTLVVSQDFTVTGTAAQLVMTDAGGPTVDIGGNVTFGGGSHVNLLTQGTMSVAGDFTVVGAGTGTFVAQTNHTTVFDGAGAQTVTFGNPERNAQRFQHVTFENGGTTTFATDVAASGQVVVTSPTAVDASLRTVLIGGGYADVANGMTLQQLIVTGDLTVTPATLTTDISVEANFNLPNDLALTGSMTLNNADLNPGANTLAVSQDFTVTGAFAQLVMTNAGGPTLDVDGNVTFSGGSHVNLLTQGTMSVAGDFTVVGAGTGTFVAQTNHTTVFDGAGAQTVTFGNPERNAQRFQHVTFENGGTTTFATDVAASGQVVVTSPTAVDASLRTVLIGGGYADVANGMTLQQLIVTGDLTVTPATLTTDISVEANFNLPNDLALTGSMTLNNNDINLSANTLAVSQDFTVTGTAAQLVMTDAGGPTVDIGGNVTFGGGSHVNLLTQGTMSVAGDFTVVGAGTGTFVAQTNHTTVFDGAGAQTVTFGNPERNAQRFQHVTFENGGTTTFATDVAASGQVVVTSPTAVDASLRTVLIGGGYADVANGMTLQQLIVTGDLTVTPATLTTDISVEANFNLPNDLALTGSMTLNNADLNLSANTLAVSQDFTVTGTAAQLVMTDAGGPTVDIGGNVTFGGGSHVNLLTQGTMSVAGDFTVVGAGTGTFVAQTNHTTVFDGAGAQTVTFGNPERNAQRFQHVTFENGGTTTFATDVAASGQVVVTSPTAVDASLRTVLIGGGYADVANGMTLQQLIVTGDLTVTPATLTTDISVEANFNLPNDLALTGSMTLNNADLNPGANTLAVSQDFTVTGAFAQLVMTNAGGPTLDVDGNVTFSGGSHVNLLTQGTMSVAGDFTVAGAGTGTFVAQTNHTTIFDGTDAITPQTLNFGGAGPTAQRFFNLTNTNSAAGVVAASDFVVAGTFTAFAGSGLDAADDQMSVAGAFEDGSAGIFLQELVIYGNLASTSSGVNADVRIDSNWTMLEDFSIGGDLTLNNADVSVGANTLAVTGDLTVTGGLFAQLVMQNAAGVLDVEGNVTFDGGNETTLLSAGTLRVAGDFSATASSNTNFVSSGSHTVIFDDPAGGLQTINFANPGTTTQRFNNLTLPFTTAPVDVGLLSDAVVMGTFEVDDIATTLRQAPLGTSILDVRGTMNVFEMTVIGVPIRLESTVAAGAHTLDNVDFVNGSYRPTDVQLYLEMPGDGVNSPFIMSGMQFDASTVITTGGAHLQTVRGSGAGIFVTELFSTSPSVANATIIEGLNTTVSWN